jgi:hypothetical protein
MIMKPPFLQLMIENGMPKKPLAARMRFNAEFFKKSTFSNSTERFRAASAAWKALDEKEKKVQLYKCT